jgi:hypothetical protein
MSTELPIACSLSPTELPARLSEIADLGRTALLSSRTHGARAELRFARRPGVRDRLDAIVAAESRCCAFLAMSVGGERDAIVLTIEAPPDARAVLQELVDAFRPA